jgi:hypothetical protein
MSLRIGNQGSVKDQSLDSGYWGFKIEVNSLGFRFRVLSLGIGFWISGSGFRVQGLGLRV